MGLDNGFVIRNKKTGDNIFDVHYRKDYALRDIILTVLGADEEGNNTYEVNAMDMQEIISRLKEVQFSGKEIFDGLTDEELAWYMDSELEECEDIENKYEKKAKINEVYKHWATKILTSILDILAEYYSATTLGTDKDYITIEFYDSY